jgi:hypothetical protein
MRRVALSLLIGAAGATLAGCFTTSADFSNDAETYIETTVAESLGVEFESVECAEPESQDVGTRFECTAVDAAGGTWVFDNEISAKNEFTVNVDRRPER